MFHTTGTVMMIVKREYCLCCTPSHIIDFDSDFDPKLSFFLPNEIVTDLWMAHRLTAIEEVNNCVPTDNNKFMISTAGAS